MRFFRDERVRYLLGVLGVFAAVVLLFAADVVFPESGERVLCALVKVCGYGVLAVSLGALGRAPRK